MTNRGKQVISALLIDLKNQSDITAQMAAQAIIVTTQRMRLPLEDFREMQSVMRTEFGWSRTDWEAMLKDLLLKLPPDLCVGEVGRVD